MATDARQHTIPTGASAVDIEQIIADLALSVRSIPQVADTSARSTLLSNLSAAGVPVSASNPLYVHRQDAGTGKQLEVSIDGSTFKTLRAEMDWTDYTPSHTNLTVGNGTQVAKWFQRDKVAFVYYSLTFGSTTSISGTVNFGLPVTAIDTILGLPGNAYCIDASASGASSRESMAIQVGSSATQVILRNDTTDLLGSTTPWTWATGDTIKFLTVVPMA